jgi:hypothetical protein
MLDGMPNKKGKKKPDNSTLARLKKEMAKPRLAKSARMPNRKLDSARILEPPARDRMPD